MAADAVLPERGQGPRPSEHGFSDRAGVEVADGVAHLVAMPHVRALRALDRLGGPHAPRGVIGAADTQDSSPRMGHGAERREQILDGAGRLFAERGYHGSSLRDISASVGISHPGMLHHFPSKPVLLDAVVDRLEAHAQGLLDAAETLSSSARSLEEAFLGPWNPAQHPMSLLATLSAEIVDPTHPGRYRVARLRLVHEHILRTVLTSFAERGLLAGDTDPAFLARSTFSLLLSLAVREKTVRELQSGGTAEPVTDIRDFLRHYLPR